jgi:hypothetical protein
MGKALQILSVRRGMIAHRLRRVAHELNIAIPSLLLPCACVQGLWPAGGGDITTGGIKKFKASRSTSMSMCALGAHLCACLSWSVLVLWHFICTHHVSLPWNAQCCTQCHSSQHSLTFVCWRWLSMLLCFVPVASTVQLLHVPDHAVPVCHWQRVRHHGGQEGRA